jgi:acyl carrier protein
MTTEPEIFERLKPLLGEVLGVAPERVRMESALIGDLGAESIDLLDLTFRIEEHFKVAIQADEIERAARQRVSGELYDTNGLFTEEALAVIRESMPELAPEKMVTGLRRSHLPALLNVAFFVRLIARKLAAAEERTSRA